MLTRLHRSAVRRISWHEESLVCPTRSSQYPSSSSGRPCRTPVQWQAHRRITVGVMFILRDHIWICPKQRKITYITENLIGLARADRVLLFGVAGPLVQVGAVDDVAQHVLAPLGYFIGNGIRRDVSLGFALVVALLVQSLFVEKNGTSREELTLSSSNAGHWMIKTYVLCVVSRGRFAVPVPCSSPAPHSAWPRGSPPGSRPCSGPWPSHGTLCTWPSKFHIKTGLSSSVIYLGPMLEILTWSSNLEKKKARHWHRWWSPGPSCSWQAGCTRGWAGTLLPWTRPNPVCKVSESQMKGIMRC